MAENFEHMPPIHLELDDNKVVAVASGERRGRFVAGDPDALAFLAPHCEGFRDVHLVNGPTGELESFVDALGRVGRMDRQRFMAVTRDKLVPEPDPLEIRVATRDDAT